MSTKIATLVCIVGILGLFYLERNRKVRSSKALWLPTIWLWILGSREVSLWLSVMGVGGAVPTNDPYLEGNPVDRIVYTGLIFLGIVVLFMRKQVVARFLRANWPILLFFVYCGMSAIWSDYTAISFKRWTKALGDPVMMLIVLTEVDRLAAVKRLLARLSFLLVPLSILFIKYYPAIGKGFKHYGLAYYTGVTTNKNLLGITCMIFGLASLWRLIGTLKNETGRIRNRQILVHVTILAMAAYLFRMAQSMTGLACFSLAGTVMIVASMNWAIRRPWILHLCVLGVASVAFSALFLSVGTGAVEAMGKDATLTGRTEIWRLALGAQDKPLIGTGFESFWMPGWRRDRLWDAFWWHPNEAHNGYIEVYLNLGYIGLALMGALLIKGYRNIFSEFRRDPEWSRLRLAYFIVAIVYNFTEAGFRMLDVVWIMCLLTVIVAPRSLRHIAKPSPLPSTSPVGKEPVTIEAPSLSEAAPPSRLQPGDRRLIWSR